MKFAFSLMGMELFSFEFALPSRGIYPVPDFIPSEADWDTTESILSILEEEDDE